MTNKYDDVYMGAAIAMAKKSYAKRLQVGCAVVKDDKIIALSYNGTPKGTDNDCEDILPDGSTKTKPVVLHAEENAIIQISKSNESIKGATVYITHAPCLPCAAKLLQAGVAKVYWCNTYRDLSGVQYLQNNGDVIVEKYNE